MLIPLVTLSLAQSHGTKSTTKYVEHLLNYSATHPDAIIRCHHINIILHIHSDVSYLSEPKACSRASGLHLLISLDKSLVPTPLLNVPINVVSNIIRNVLASVTKAEVCSLFHND